MDQRRGGDQRVAVGAGTGDVGVGAWAGHFGVHGQGTLAEAGRDLVLQPAAQPAAPDRVAVFEAQDARLPLEQQDRGEAEQGGRGAVGPGADRGRGTVGRPSLRWRAALR